MILPSLVHRSLQFQFLNDQENPANFDLKSLKILRYDPEKRRWEDIGGVVHPAPINVVSVKTIELGTFALVARGAAKETREDTGSMLWQLLSGLPLNHTSALAR